MMFAYSYVVFWSNIRDYSFLFKFYNPFFSWNQNLSIQNQLVYFSYVNLKSNSYLKKGMRKL